LEIRPDYLKAHINLGIALLGRGQLKDAEQHFRRALEVEPDHFNASLNLAFALDRQGKTQEALALWRDALRRQHHEVPSGVRNRCAWILATDADPSIRNAGEAIALAEQCVRDSGGKIADYLDTLAAAYAAAGRFPEAVEVALSALSQASSRGLTSHADALKKRIELYKAGVPYRERRGNN
jgi:spermidine synthase